MIENEPAFQLHMYHSQHGIARNRPQRDNVHTQVPMDEPIDPTGVT